MPPKKTKAEEAADFLSTLDLDVPEDTPAPSAAATAPSRISADVKRSDASPRASIDSKRSVKSSETARAGSPAPASPSAASKAAGAGSGGGKEDEEAQKALDFLEAQINTKRTPLSVPGPASLRAPSPLSGPARTGAQAGASGSSSSNSSGGAAPANVPTNSAAEEQKQGGGGWGSWWSSASSAIQSAQKIADEGYKKVRTEGVAGLENVKVAGMDLGTLRKGAEERLKGIQLPQGITLPQGIDLEKLRHDLLTNTQSALTQLINTVAPPISAHETLELWLSHPMTGYAGVEGVVYRAWTSILEQTESGELIVVWSPPASAEGIEERGINPVDGWTAAWELTVKEIGEVKQREEKEPKGRAHQNPEVPVTTVPIFLHLQPVLAPLNIPEPPLLMSESESASTSASATESKDKGPKKHLHFIITLQDPVHSLRFTSVSQPCPADWLEVEYERSDWVEERLVDVLRTGVEVVAQDYVATRMGLKTSAADKAAVAASLSAETSVAAGEADGKKD